jgi:hypothetical protein
MGVFFLDVMLSIKMQAPNEVIYHRLITGYIEICYIIFESSYIFVMKED